MSRNVVKAEARRLIEEHSDETYVKATTAVRLAMRRRIPIMRITVSLHALRA